jgi:non-ribosomal peptide synthetase component F
MKYLVHHLLEAAARQYPDSTAVVDRDRTLTYEQLDALSNRLASTLRQCGVKKGDRVGLYMDKSLESVVAVYGVMKTGAAYVPFDPDAPVARLAYIARDCGIRVLIAGVEKQDRWRPLLDAGAPIEIRVVLKSERVPKPQ